MKYIINILIITLLSIILVACNNNTAHGEHEHDGIDHKEMNHKDDGMDHKEMNHKENHKEIAKKGKDMLKKEKTFLSSYFVIQKKLVESNLPSKDDINTLALSLTQNLKSSNMEKKALEESIKIVKNMDNTDLKKIRDDFYELSKILIPLTKKMKLKGVQAYYCPMAKKTWLQNQSNITYNPYIPKKMLHCGSKI